MPCSAVLKDLMGTTNEAILVDIVCDLVPQLAKCTPLKAGRKRLVCLGPEKMRMRSILSVENNVYG